jgi:hypothetical protein
MTASSEVVLSNLAYLIGAVVLAIIGGLIVWLRHRQPRSVDANVESFHRGLRALAPDGSQPASGRAAATTASCGLRIQPRPAVAIVPDAGDHFDTEAAPQTGLNGHAEESDPLHQGEVNGGVRRDHPSLGAEPQPSGPDPTDSSDPSCQPAMDVAGSDRPVPKPARS